VNNIHSTPDIVNVIKLERMKRSIRATQMGEIWNAYWYFVGKSQGKRTNGGSSHTWEDNIKTKLRERGCEYVKWIQLVQDMAQWRASLNTMRNFQMLWRQRIPWPAQELLTIRGRIC